MAVTGRSPKHPRTESDDNSLDVGALLEKAADRFSMSMEANIKSMMEQMDKRIDDKIDSKLVPVMDRISALEGRTSTISTTSGPSSSSDGSSGNTTGPVIFAPSYLEIKGSKYTWLDREASKGFHHQVAPRNWTRIG